ncbi:MAG: HAMP domain-containing protein [Planctomycetes bacterium]|nr:HAMP domain-containing protein [Planctomycetota bacterium]
MQHRLATRYALAMIAAAPVVAAIIGSIFNIWYNVSQVKPLLSDEQNDVFQSAIFYYNVFAYPPLVGVWVASVFSLRRIFKPLLAGAASDSLNEAELARARVRTINLPWHISAVMAVGWVLCIPALLFGLKQSPGAVDVRVLFHLPTSVIIAALITITHAFFIVELLTERLLFPVLFRDASPSRVPGAVSLPLNRRTMLTAFAICVCPILSLVLLAFVDADTMKETNLFMVYVGGVGIVLGLLCSWMFTRHVSVPVRKLTSAAHEIGVGNLDVEIRLQRADEFGPLIDEFNRMVEEMRAKRELRRRFGLHVGRRTAELILTADPGLSGTETDITVMFCDIRNFTARCAETPADQIVPLLNQFLTMMVDVVENRHHGNVNKFLGDGFMALFGIGQTGDPAASPEMRNHAQDAVSAGLQMIEKLAAMNAELDGTDIQQLGIGIGIHSGTAIVGSMGSEDRLEYTAIGDTVNLAARVEGLTKVVGEPLLFTKAARDRLGEGLPVKTLEPQTVKGQPMPVEIFTMNDQGAS